MDREKHNHTCGERAVNVWYGDFFLLPIHIENRKVFPKKTRVLMKNVCYLHRFRTGSEDQIYKKNEDKI